MLPPGEQIIPPSRVYVRIARRGSFFKVRKGRPRQYNSLIYRRNCRIESSVKDVCGRSDGGLTGPQCRLRRQEVMCWSHGTSVRKNAKHKRQQNHISSREHRHGEQKQDGSLLGELRAVGQKDYQWACSCAVLLVRHPNRWVAGWTRPCGEYTSARRTLGTPRSRRPHTLGEPLGVWSLA